MSSAAGPSEVAPAPIVEKPHRAKPTSGTSGLIRPTRWSVREEQRRKAELLKARERAMKEEKESVGRAKREARIERRRKKEEKERLEMMGKKMSAKKLDRKKRRMGWTKKVSH